MGELYLGRHIDSKVLDGQYHHRLSDLVTHTFICGASGSGKTVMGKAIIEEAALCGVPAIIIDLKGDLSSLALAFPELSAPMLAPWVYVEDSELLGRSALAEANRLRAHLVEWGLTESDVRQFGEKIVVEVFTPRSDRGRRIAMPLVPSAPADFNNLLQDDPDTTLSMVSSLAEALIRRVISSGQRDREQDYMTALIEYAWRNQLDLSGIEGIHRIVELILDPPFEKIGALTVEDHLPEKRRQRLAQAVNGQIVGADANWLRGEELNIDTLVGGNRRDSRTQVSIINLTAVSNFDDQSFVVAQIAFAINAWMRHQGTAPGGDKPRLLFFIDEIGGGGGKTAFYPTYPYSSAAKPALTLLVKQGRAFGVGCILATQNPGDIDYKGLANCSTWIIGKLQTKRDRDKIQQGLADADFKPSDLAKKLAAPATGQFMLMTRDGEVTIIQERWLLTYHMTLGPEQLSRLKVHGLSPYEGALVTDIQEATLKFRDEGNSEFLWKEVYEAVSIACKRLESILNQDPSNSRAQAMLETLRDPEGIYRRLHASLARSHELTVTKRDRIEEPRTDLIDLLKRMAPSNHLVTQQMKVLTDEKVSLKSDEGHIVDGDGCVTYKGRRYALYRRYGGKMVTIIEEGNILKFLIEGRMLSKTYPTES